MRWRSFTAALAAIGAAVLVATSAASADAPVATYEVTITNLTGAQPFTPPALAVHRRPFDLFDVGGPASLEVKEIAENGNLTPMLDLFQSSSHVFDWAVVADGNSEPAPVGGVLFPSTQSFTLESGTGAKYLSWVSMLICTNDGFTGVDSLRLPKQVGDTETVYTAGYDAGTEVNTEDFADIVPPCPVLSGVPSSDPGTGVSDPALAEGGVIHHHEGIVGDDDLDAMIHGWSDPVARLTVERIG